MSGFPPFGVVYWVVLGDFLSISAAQMPSTGRSLPNQYGLVTCLDLELIAVDLMVGVQEEKSRFDHLVLLIRVARHPTRTADPRTGCHPEKAAQTGSVIDPNLY